MVVRRSSLRPTLNVQLSQRLAMTPSLLQKIELLTLSRVELSEMLSEELVSNPVLEEVAEDHDDEAGEWSGQEAGGREDAPEDRTRYWYADGTEVQLQPGATWVALLPVGSPFSWS